ncbi:MAG: class I adenylate-forming enzyme family protein [Marinilabiliaceae bacterium]
MNAVDFFFENSATLDKELLVGRGERVSYRGMSRSVSKLSAYLEKHYSKGSVIILISPNNSFFVTVYLAVMKSGCICVPLNPAIEPANFSYVVEKTRAVHVFLHSSVGNRIFQDKEANSGGRGVDYAHRGLFESLVFTDEKEYGSLIAVNGDASYLPGPDMDSDDTAQVIFTSGSTSVPKGVMITHGNLIANTQSILDYLRLGRDDVMLVVLPFFYCYGLSLLHTHMRVGGTLVLNNSFMFLGGVLRDLRQHECTGFAGVPSHFQVLLRKSDSFRNGHFPALRYVTQAGGKLHKSFISEFIDTFPDVRFFVMYGQTEATARLSYLPPELLDEKLGSIGKGIPGVELRVVDENGIDVNVGQPGEIIARGRNIMKGYLGDEAATRETLRDGWLHTGDVGIVDEDGFIYLSARKKEMIKVGGKRVSPREIEEVVVAMPGVIDCTVEGYEHPVLGEALRAIVVKAGEVVVSADDVRAACARKLASFKVPSEVSFKTAMEVSSTGKKVKGTL